jgi:hypothetical protein
MRHRRNKFQPANNQIGRRESPDIFCVSQLPIAGESPATPPAAGLPA